MSVIILSTSFKSLSKALNLVVLWKVKLTADKLGGLAGANKLKIESISSIALCTVVVEVKLLFPVVEAPNWITVASPPPPLLPP